MYDQIACRITQQSLHYKPYCWLVLIGQQCHLDKNDNVLLSSFLIKILQYQLKFSSFSTPFGVIIKYFKKIVNNIYTIWCNNMKINIGKSLKNIRESENLTQSKLAEKTGISQQSISRWESGQRFPNILDLVKLADYYKISIDELIGREN